MGASARVGGPRIRIWLNDRRLEVPQGVSLAAGLWARGRKTLSRSMRYHRARGLFCGTGECTACLMRVDGVPNVRACQVPTREGLVAEDQNAFPSVRRDVLALSDVVFPRYLDAHSAFIRPHFLKPLFTPIIRGMAGFGKIPSAGVAQRFDARKETADLLVVGAGPAGLSAAEAAAGKGLKVLLLERDGRLGGRLAWSMRPEAQEWIRDRMEAVAQSGVRTVPNARLLGLYEDRQFLGATRSALLAIEAPRLLLATGARDAWLAFPGSDRAGVLLGSAAARMLAEDGILPGRRPVILGSGTETVELARAMANAGASVGELYEPTDAPRSEGTPEFPVRRGHVPVRAEGRARFARIRFKTPEGERTVRGDVLILATGRNARSELAQQAGCRLAHRAGFGFIAESDANGRSNKSGVWAAGSMAGMPSWKEAAEQGARAGRDAARDAAP